MIPMKTTMSEDTNIDRLLALHGSMEARDLLGLHIVEELLIYTFLFKRCNKPRSHPLSMSDFMVM